PACRAAAWRRGAGRAPARACSSAPGADRPARGRGARVRTGRTVRWSCRSRPGSWAAAGVHVVEVPAQQCRLALVHAPDEVEDRGAAVIAARQRLLHEPCRVLGARMARPVVHGTTLPGRGLQVLALEVREERGDGGVGVMVAQAFDQLTDRLLVMGPQLLHHLLLQRPQTQLLEGAGGLGAAHGAATRWARAAAGIGQAT